MYETLYLECGWNPCWHYRFYYTKRVLNILGEDVDYLPSCCIQSKILVKECIYFLVGLP